MSGRFLIIPGEILQNVNIRPLEKMILSFIYNLERSGKQCFVTADYLGMLLGVKEEWIAKFFLELEEKGFISIFGSVLKLEVSLDFLKYYNPKSSGGELKWQDSKAISETFTAKLEV